MDDKSLGIICHILLQYELIYNDLRACMAVVYDF